MATEPPENRRPGDPPEGSDGAATDRQPGPPLPDLPPGTTLLVSGPPTIGKRDLMFEAIADGFSGGEAGVVVSTRSDAGSVADGLARAADRVGTRPAFGRLGVVDCLSSEGAGPGAGAGTGGPGTTAGGGQVVDAGPGSVRVRGAGSPADLTGIGIAASELLAEFDDAGVRLGVDSLSTMLLYSDFDRLFRFLHVLSGRVARTGAVGLFAVNPGAMESAQFDQLRTLFDGVVELRRGEDGRELRVRGLRGTDDAWRPYPPGDGS